MLLDWAATIDWFKVVSSLASLATALVAFLALRNWRGQDKAKREAEFLDELIESTHAYITLMPRAVELLRYARIGIISHGAIYDPNAEPTVDGAIAYISKNGVDTGKRLRHALSETQPYVVKLRSLGDKGQIFRFPKYANCVNGIVQITWQFDRLGAFLNVVGSPSWNWNNPQVRSLLEKVMKIDPSDIEKALADHHREILLFSRQAYEKLYK